MPTIILSIHGGRQCGKYCRWNPSGLDNLGPGDWHMGGYSDRAVIALDNKGHLVGVWQYDKEPKKILSCGTWVIPKYRKHGIAKKMWEFGIIREKPRNVGVMVVTDRGYSLVDSIRKRFSNIKWDIREGGCRRLRRL
jgi:hypothetical protein